MRPIVVITGGTAGVGRATAVRFAQGGYDVAILARGAAGLGGARRELEALGARVLPIACDVADPLQVETAAARVEAELGPIDVWVNCAMVTVFAEFTDIQPDEFRRVTDVTYHGFVWGTRSALARMRPRDRGTIVQVGSALAYRGIPLQSAYCGAKHAIQGFTEAVRCELLHDRSNVWITMVQLPAVNTPQFEWGRNKMPRESQPVPPIYQPEVIADGIFFAAHERRAEVRVGWSTEYAIVGNKVAPALGDRYLAKTGFDSQMLPEPRQQDRRDNLFEPVDDDRDFGAHGQFGDRARGSSVQLAITEHRASILGALALLAIGIAARLVRARA